MTAHSGRDFLKNLFSQRNPTLKSILESFGNPGNKNEHRPVDVAIFSNVAVTL